MLRKNPCIYRIFNKAIEYILSSAYFTRIIYETALTYVLRFYICKNLCIHNATKTTKKKCGKPLRTFNLDDVQKDSKS